MRAVDRLALPPSAQEPVTPSVEVNLHNGRLGFGVRPDGVLIVSHITASGDQVTNIHIGMEGQAALRDMLSPVPVVPR